MTLAGCQINLIDVIFHFSILEIFDRNLADKIWSKKDKEIKVSPLMPIRIKQGLCKLNDEILFSVVVDVITH